ncbi:hypothetical protein D9M69_650240 [compost metagenome]
MKSGHALNSLNVRVVLVQRILQPVFAPADDLLPGLRLTRIGYHLPLEALSLDHKHSVTGYNNMVYLGRFTRLLSTVERVGKYLVFPG